MPKRKTERRKENKKMKKDNRRTNNLKYEGNERRGQMEGEPTVQLVRKNHQDGRR